MELAEFAKRTNALANSIPTLANQLKQRVVNNVADSLITETPVDVSTALSNWIVGVNIILTGKFLAVVPGKHGSTAAQSRDAAKRFAAVVIARSKPGDWLSIANNLPYIKRLNEGWSKQAPAGFVEKAVSRGIGYLRSQAQTMRFKL